MPEKRRGGLGRSKVYISGSLDMPTRSLAIALAIAALYALHQDVWFWRAARPLLFGFLPVGLAYHGAYCLAAALLMWTLTRVAWPHHLEDVPSQKEPRR
jgi:hypothetical protein